MSAIKSRQSRAKAKAVLFGAASISLYAAVFTFSDTVLHYCARGGFYNLLPVSAVFLFSYVHGTFASNTWTALGVEASSKSVKKTAAKDKTVPKPQKQARRQAVAD
ncbi:MAG: hypothetical protein SVS15_03405 [Thermodesulfobacteriota bacterium]|nr:hypothetical protein [Thermodesulfobacteriota bacterium]